MILGAARRRLYGALAVIIWDELVFSESLKMHVSKNDVHDCRLDWI